MSTASATLTEPRQQLHEAARLTEAALDGRRLRLTIIRAGFNSSRSRYYTVEALRDSGAVFNGLKQYVNHQTFSEEMERPEGDIRDWAANLTSVEYDEASRSLRGEAVIIDPQFAERMQALDEAGLLGEMGVSIRAIGEGEDTEIDGFPTFRVDRFVAGRSVDFVTEPGAGGRVEMRESDTATNPQEDTMAVEQQLAEATRRAAEADAAQRTAEERARAAEERAVAAEAAVEELRAQAAVVTAQAEIDRQLGESQLPESTRTYLRTQLTGETDMNRVREAIDHMRTMVTEIAGEGVVRGAGPSETADDQVSREARDKARLERYTALGMDEKQAAIMLNGRGGA